jgi:hypothetical protein
MTDKLSREIQEFCPHCKESIVMVFNHPIASRPIMIPRSDRTIENTI